MENTKPDLLLSLQGKGVEAACSAPLTRSEVHPVLLGIACSGLPARAYAFHPFFSFRSASVVVWSFSYCCDIFSLSACHHCWACHLVTDGASHPAAYLSGALHPMVWRDSWEERRYALAMNAVPTVSLGKPSTAWQCETKACAAAQPVEKVTFECNNTFFRLWDSFCNLCLSKKVQQSWKGKRPGHIGTWWFTSPHKQKVWAARFSYIHG